MSAIDVREKSGSVDVPFPDLSAQDKDAELAKHPGETPAFSVSSMLRVIDGATRENAGGKFMDVSGGVNEW